jgi:hypothetical protein
MYVLVLSKRVNKHDGQKRRWQGNVEHTGRSENVRSEGRRGKEWMGGHDEAPRSFLFLDGCRGRAGTTGTLIGRAPLLVSCPPFSLASMEPFSRACLSAMKRGMESSQILTGQRNGRQLGGQRREGGAAEYRRRPCESIGCAGIVADTEAESLQPSQRCTVSRHSSMMFSLAYSLFSTRQPTVT